MELLPIADIPMELEMAGVISTQSAFAYDKFTKEIKDHLENDCWALTINNEVLFNGFAEQTFNEFMLDHMKRDALINNVHGALLVKINRENKPVIGRIYMCGRDGYVFVFEYKPDTKLYVTYYLKTAGYVE